MIEVSIGLIDLIIRDVAEIERDPLPGQSPDEMRVTENELRAILEERFWPLLPARL